MYTVTNKVITRPYSSTAEHSDNVSISMLFLR